MVSICINTVSPSYFATMGTRIVRGRGFTDADRDGAPRVIVVSESMAKQALARTADAIGKCIRVGADTVPCSTVVGVAADIVDRSLADPRGMTVLRADRAARRRRQRSVRPHARRRHGHGRQPLGASSSVSCPASRTSTVTPLTKILEPNVRSWRLGATMFALFGGLALLLAAVGLYSVIAYNVTQRTHELGVRIALGAQGRDVLRLVVGSGLRVAIAGIVIGGTIALVAGRFIAPLLYRVSPKDPLIYAIAARDAARRCRCSRVWFPRDERREWIPNVALRAD